MHRIREWRAGGYTVKLIFLRLPTAGLAVQRVRSRARQGGHDVPEGLIRSRYDTGWQNFLSLYRDLVDEWIVYDSSGATPQAVDFGIKR